ncbi:MAG: nucleotidyltransferase family protein [Ruminococcaceae bacterium]|nr:nucleotidyltransferase family protein [Oscillospiraceae bacterium]
MKAAAVICECNPYHFGHRHVFSEARRTADCVIAVMSGNFVQRAEAAVFDKYARAEAVLRCGADLVVELPFPWSSASAEFFAGAGVSLAASLGADVLVFGAAQADIALYRRIADILLSEEFHCQFAAASAGNSGAAAVRQKCLAQYIGESDAEIMQIPNDILAVEYCKAVREQNLSLRMIPVRRISSEEIPAFRSASCIREILSGGNFTEAAEFMPPEAADIFRQALECGKFAPGQPLAQILFQHLRLCRNIPETADGTDGVLERLIRCAGESSCAEEMYTRAATKKYTNTRFRRAALFHLMGILLQDLRAMPRFTHLLAASRAGCAYLAQIRKSAGVQILTKPSDGPTEESARRQYEKQCEADRLYTLCMKNILSAGEYLRRTPIIDR